ncbi:MAG: 23S rRNA (uracil(1939)-C(5))-methyltransferase RlmD, partial [Lachnospiraceae bacterium]|nr:23S rRNA (uracil(1939)-C(5))-methyltransferase RlmD [Lachnospiraceae bacterium]
EPIVGAERLYNYRNKAQFPVGTDRNGDPVIGFYRKHSHDVVSNTDCCIQAPVNRLIMERVLGFMKEQRIPAYNEETGKGLVRHVFTRVGFATKEVMVCLVINGDDLKGAEKLAKELADVIEGEGLKLTSFCLDINKKNTNVIMGDRVTCVYGNPWIEDKIGDITYRISPLSFYQVNPEQTLKLYNLALEYAGLTGSETVWDLYCGIGTISLFLAQKAKEVYGVEIVPEAIEDAKVNAEINGITNAFFRAGAAEDLAPGLSRPDVIVVDPPRKGCDEKLLETILKNSPKRVVYVSCDPATLARDLKILVSGGYELTRVRPVDQFLHSGGHIETVALLSRSTQ